MVLFPYCLVDGGAAYLRVKFNSFNSHGRDWGNSKCDGIWSSCDPWFTSVQLVTSLGTHYSASGSNDYGNSNSFNFGSTISGNIPNPFTSSKMSSWPGGFYLKVTIYDKDGGLLGGSDLLDIYNSYLSGSRKTSTSSWSSATLYGTRSSSKSVLTIQWQAYCATYYYGTSCNVYCKPTSTSSASYTCNTSTGSKICATYFYGTNCNTYCKNTDSSSGHYTCSSTGQKQCLAGWTSTNCLTSIDDCASNPCANGATCNDGHLQYTCQCAQYYSGTRCTSWSSPMPPRSPTLTARTSSTASISWTAPAQSAAIGGYSITVTKSSVTVHGSSTTATSKSLSNLLPAQHYTATIKAYYSGYNSAQLLSTGVSLNFIMLPGAVRSLQISSKTTTNLQASWTTPDQSPSVTGYRVVMTPASGSTQTNDVTSVSWSKTGLTPGKQYSVAVRSYILDSNNGNARLYSTSSSISAVMVPKNPTGLSVTSFTTTRISVSWTAPSGSIQDSYVLSRSPSHGTISITGTAADVNGLTPGKAYSFSVKASSSGVQSASSTSVTGSTTPSAASSFTAVRDPTYVDGVKFTWVLGAGERNYFKILYSPGSGSLLNIASTATTVTIPNLTFDQTYTFSLSAVSDDSKVSASVSKTYTVPSVPVPSNFRVVSTTTTTINLQWNAVTDLTGFNFIITTYSNSTSSQLQTATVASTSSSKTITGLDPGKPYRFTIVMTKGGKTGNQAEVIDNTNPLPPTNLAVLSSPVITTTDITLSWSPAVGSTQDSYRLITTPIGGSGVTTTHSTTQTTVTGLTSGQMYQFVVQASINGRHSVDSSAVQDSTIPTAVASLSVAQATDIDTVTVTWTHGAGVRATYTLTYNGNTVSNIAGSLISKTIVGLYLGTTYTFSIVAVSNSKTGQSVSQQYPTPGYPIVLNLAVSSVTTTGITVTWSQVTVLSSYTYTMTYADTDTNTIQTITGITEGVTSKVFSGLDSGKQYNITIAVTKYGSSGPEVNLIDNTDPLPPTNFAASQVTTNQVSFSWNGAAGSREDSYVIIATPTDGISPVVENIVTNTSSTVTNLIPGRQYSFTVKAISYNRRGGASSALQDSMVPSAVSSLNVGQSTYLDSIEVALNHGAGVRSHYIITYDQQTVDNVTALSTIISDLTLGDSYTVNVTANSHGKLSDVVTYVYNVPACPPVSGLMVSSVTTTTMTVNWTAVTNLINFSFNMTYTNVLNGSTTDVITDLLTTDSSKTITGLTPGHSYEVTMDITKGTTTGPLVSVNDTIIPSAVQNVTVQKGYFDDSVDLTWIPASGTWDTFTVTYDTGVVTDIPSTQYDQTINWLKMGTAFVFTVTAVSKGRSSAGVSQNYSTPVYPVPQNLQVFTDTETTMEVNWTAVSDPILPNFNYTLTCTTYGTVARRIEFIDKNVTDMAVTGLAAGTVYNVTLIVVNGHIEGEPAMVTDNTVPSVPVGLTLTDVSTTVVNVTWVQHSHLTYTIEYEASSGSSLQNTSCVNSPCSVDTSPVGIPGTEVRAYIIATLWGKSSGNTSSIGRTKPVTPVNFTEVESQRTTTLYVVTWAPVMASQTLFDVYRLNAYNSGSGNLVFGPMTLPNTSSTAAFPTMTPGAEYRVTLNTVLDTNYYSEPATLMVRTYPDPATSLTVSSFQTHQLTFSWGPPAAGVHTKYRIQLTEVSNSDTPTTALNHTFTDLTPGTLYSPVLEVQSGEDNSNTMTKSQQTTLDNMYTLPMAVTMLDPDTTTTTVTAKWLPPIEGSTLGYMIMFLESDCMTKQASTRYVEKYVTDHTVDGLQPGTTYCIKVATYVGYGAYRKTNMVTYKATTVPNPPQTPQTSSVSNDGVTLSWGAPSQTTIITGYFITITLVGSIYPVQTQTITGGAMGYSVTNLDPGLDYTISVKSFTVNADGDNTYSVESVTSITTAGTPVQSPGSANGTGSNSLQGGLFPYKTDSTVFTSAYSRLQSTSFYAREYSLPDTMFLSGQCITCRMGITSVGYVTIRGQESQYFQNLYLRRTGAPWDEAITAWGRTAALHSGHYILAPFWTDTDYTLGGNSQVYYGHYINTDTQTSTQNMLQTCNDAVSTYTNYNGFSTSYASIVTWENMVPPTSTPDLQTNTFQLVLISGTLTDQRSLTFALYLYGGITWTVQQPVQIGYYLQNPQYSAFDKYTDETFANVASPYDKLTVYEIDTTVNQKTGKAGVYFYQLVSENSQTTDENLCLNWYNSEKAMTPVPYYSTVMKYTTPQYLDYISSTYGEQISCPCDVTQATADSQRWLYDEFQQNELQSGKTCYYYRTPLAYTSKTCCYNNDGALITAKDGTGGYTYLFHPSDTYSKDLRVIHDNPYYTLCCERTNNCDKFYEMRPMDDCTQYKPPIYCTCEGDPHITTLDGHKYTFNGHGEYWLIQTTTSEFSMQARTDYVLDVHNIEKNASVFMVIAAKDNGGHLVQIELNANRTDLIVTADYTDITDSWFNTVSNGTDLFTYNKVTLTKLSNTSVGAVFDSGFTLVVSKGDKQLVISAGAPTSYKQKIKGLLGFYNGNVTDDFTKKDGTTISINSAQEEIYHNFGETWRTTEYESIFMYAVGKTHSDYVHTDFVPVYFRELEPLFNSSIWDMMNSSCQGDVFCIYDYAMTGDFSFASVTVQATADNELKVLALANTRPTLTVDQYYNVTLGQTSDLQVTVTDSDTGDSVTVNYTFIKQSNNADISQQATFNGSVLTWTPNNSDHVTLRLTAVDSRGGRSPEVEVMIRFCECASTSNNGLCVFNTVRTGQSTTAPFQYVECICNAGLTGNKCDEDINGCANSPCGANSVCTDVAAVNDTSSPMGGDFTCGDCNQGYKKRSGLNSDCININECSEGTDTCDPSNGLCTDTMGSFTCYCKPGYKLHSNGVNCTDIDECSEGSSGCGHLCINTVGSFQCDCQSGYILDPDGKTCNMTESLTMLCANSSCDYCQGNSTAVQCFCPDGFTLQSDGQTCTDIDECSSPSNNTCDSHTSNCSNTNGSYECTCNAGYTLQQDQRTCKACSSGYWGVNCTNICRCKSGTTCDTALGCSQCADAGFTGSNCDTDVNECNATAGLCGDGTTGCTNTVGSYKCPCMTGYQAVNTTHCQDIDDCDSQPCLNGGVCTNNGSGPGYSCNCKVGYTGGSCQTNIDDCVNSTCLNGAACQDGVNQYTCVCSSDYRGKDCEVYIPLQTIEDNINQDIGGTQHQTGTETGSGLSTVVIGAAIGAIIAVIVAAIVAIYIYKKKKKSENETKSLDKKNGPVDDSSSPSVTAEDEKKPPVLQVGGWLGYTGGDTAPGSKMEKMGSNTESVPGDTAVAGKMEKMDSNTGISTGDTAAPAKMEKMDGNTGNAPGDTAAPGKMEKMDGNTGNAPGDMAAAGKMDGFTGTAPVSVTRPNGNKRIKSPRQMQKAVNIADHFKAWFRSRKDNNLVDAKGVDTNNTADVPVIQSQAPVQTDFYNLKPKQPGQNTNPFSKKAAGFPGIPSQPFANNLNAFHGNDAFKTIPKVHTDN